MEPNIIRRDQHPISRKQMPEEVLKVLYRLHRTGHLAYLCGGGVRDLMLRRPAGDFDVATDAEPNRIKEVFRNCRLVGKRFRLAHILFKGGKFIEVSTFRKESGDNGDENGDSLLIRRDNTYGTPAEDAFRRDFTVNALYYNIADFTVIDYVGGREDLEARLIRCIGDPNIRFQEDPIRILRGIRLAATLDFKIEENTWEGMIRQRQHILECAEPRIREELMKMLRRGSARRSFALMQDSGVLAVILPQLAAFVSGTEGGVRPVELFWRHLQVLDEAQQQVDDLPDSMLLAVLVLAPAMQELSQLPPGADAGKALRDYLDGLLQRYNFPRQMRAEAHMLILGLRALLRSRQQRRRRRSIRNSPIFNPALKLLEIHCRASDDHWNVLERWRRPPPRRRRRRGRKRAKGDREGAT